MMTRSTRRGRRALGQGSSQMFFTKADATKAIRKHIVEDTYRTGLPTEPSAYVMTRVVRALAVEQPITGMVEVTKSGRRFADALAANMR